jgi:putative ABC transport system permease protein
MSIASDLRTRLSALVHRRVMERELDEELAYHLDREAEKLERDGWEPAAARREAMRRFGGVQRHREEAREAWGLAWLEDLWRDLRVGARSLAKAPALTAAAILTLGLGIGGTLALYGAAYALLMRPLPFEAGDRIEVFWYEQSWRGEEFDFAREHLRAFDRIAAYVAMVSTLERDGQREPIATILASAELFDVLGARPLLGRTFRPGEDRPGAERVVVLSHALWQQSFGADEAVVGRTVNLDNQPARVIGVMRPEFYFPDHDQRAWMPLSLDPADPAYSNNGWLVVLGRVAEGASPAEVRGDVAALASRLGESFQYSADWDKSRGAHTTPLRAYLFGNVTPVLRLLQGATALLLVMALVNVAALLLSRMVDRAHEMRLRSALGASRGRLVRQVLTESTLIAAIAGGLGILLALAGFRALAMRLPLGGGFGAAIELEPWLLAGAFVGAVALGAVVGLAPLQRLLRDRPSDLRPGGTRAESGGAAAGGGRLQTLLVAAQIIVAVVLVSGATLFARSVAQLYRVELGLRPAGVGALMVRVDPSTPGGSAAWVPRLLEGVRAVPGVRTAAFGARLPLRDGGLQGSTDIRDRPELTGETALNAYFRPITPEYLETMGMRLQAGRGIRDTDRAGGELVALVNATFAEVVWGEEDPLGKAVIPTFGNDWARVVGVVDDVPLEGVRAPPPLVVYVPWAQWEGAWPAGVLTFRTDGDPASLLDAVREAAEASDPTAVGMQPTTLVQALDGSIADALRLRFFVGALALLALFVGGVGVYGVVSYTVSRRTREFGIRMALGADRGRVVREVLLREAPPLVIGVVGGVALAVATARAAAGLVYGVRPLDPVSLLVGAGLLCAVGAAAALTPALRASVVAPARVLRGE